MQDETPAILAAFNAYTEAFKKQDPRLLVECYDYPSTINNKEKTILMFHPIVGYFVFRSILADFAKKNYGYSILNIMTAKQMGETLGLVSGRATRHQKNDQPYEEFGFTYALRKKDGKWKIISGLIHDYDQFLTLS